jgi:hypothetical protein
MKGFFANSSFQEKIYIAHFSILDGFCMIILPQNQSSALLRLPEKERLFHVHFVLKKIKSPEF